MFILRDKTLELFHSLNLYLYVLHRLLQSPGRLEVFHLELGHFFFHSITLLLRTCSVICFPCQPFLQQLVSTTKMLRRLLLVSTISS